MTTPKMLILMAGMPGSGKGTVTQALGRELGLPVIDKDVMLCESGAGESVGRDSCSHDNLERIRRHVGGDHSRDPGGQSHR